MVSLMFRRRNIFLIIISLLLLNIFIHIRLPRWWNDKNWSGPVRICNSFCDLRFTEIVPVGLGYWRKPNLTINLYPNENISRQL